MAIELNRNKDDPWRLKTPPGSSDFTMHTNERDGQPVLVCTVGSTVRFYDARCIDDLHRMLQAAGDWVELGRSDSSSSRAPRGTIESARSERGMPAGRFS